MAADDYILGITQGAAPPLPSGTSDELAALALRLKTEADRHWHIDPQVSLRCADAIIAIGVATGHVPTIALGTMARGDALKLLDRPEEAWLTLDRAGDLYGQAGDEVGWARTRIGRLAVAVQLNRMEEAMRDAALARETLVTHGIHDRVLILEINIGAAWNYFGDYRKAQTHYDAALAQALALGESGTRFLGMIYTNLGYAEQGLGHLRRAEALYEQAHSVLQNQGEQGGAALALHNMATVAQAQGRFRHALALFYRSIDAISRFQPGFSRKARLDMAECYLLLTRGEDALALARDVLDEQTTGDDDYIRALTLLHVAGAETLLRRYEDASEHLGQAEAIFAGLGAESWLADVQLRRARLGLRSSPDAQAEIAELIRYFERAGEQLRAARARLLMADLELNGGDLAGARDDAVAALASARRHDLLPLRYDAHLLLGRAEEATGRPRRALRHYHAAAAATERLQRMLTLTLRSSALEHRQDAVRGMLRLYLAEGAVEQALLALERAKSQVWLRYLREGERLRLPPTARGAESLMAELIELREAQYWYYRVAHDPAFRAAQHAAISPTDAAQEAVVRERRLRALAERLDVLQGEDAGSGEAVPVTDIQARLGDDTCLIAYYDDGVRLWAFMLTRHAVALYPLTDSSVVVRLQEKLLQNIDRAVRAGPAATETALLGRYARELAQQLYAPLLGPFAAVVQPFPRLVIVPYGRLHGFPFHLVHDGAAHLIEQHEIVVLPAANLLVRGSVQRQPGALALAHDWDGRLSHTVREAHAVVGRLGGDVMAADAARKHALSQPPRQVLHIAAHGQFRIDQPDLSYIHLADGALHTDELMEYDLSYELVTVSACETARSHVAPGDEVVGIGRGLLFAGARAVVASLWRVDDALTGDVMDGFYRSLADGAGKAAALREAQLSLLRAHPGLHPAFWGAFELIGSADPLSRPEAEPESAA